MMSQDRDRAESPSSPADARRGFHLSSEDLEWRTFPEAEGVEYKVLRRHPEAGGSTLLLRFAPGADYPAHRHPAGEEYFVLSGSLEDGYSSYRAGDYIYYPPGSIHRPASREGCTLLVVLPARVEPLQPFSEERNR